MLVYSCIGTGGSHKEQMIPIFQEFQGVVNLEGDEELIGHKSCGQLPCIGICG